MTTWGSVSQPRRPSLLVTAIFALIGSITFPLSTYATSSQITQLSATGPAQVNQGELTTDITIETRNADGTPEILLPAGATLALSSTSPTGTFYTSNDTTTSVQNVTMTPGTSSTTVRYLDTTPGEYTLKFNLSGSNLSETLMTERQITVIDTSPVDASQITFNQEKAYRVRATNIELRGDSRAIEARFTVNGEVISTVTNVSSQPQSYSLWRLPSTPVAGSSLAGELRVGDAWYPAANQVALYEAPSLALTSAASVAENATLDVTGSVNGYTDSASVSVQLMRLSDGTVVISPQNVSARGDGVLLAQFNLSGITPGDYIVRVIASDGEGELSTSDAPLNIQAAPEPGTDIPHSPVIVSPVQPVTDVFIPEIEVDPIEPLSTAFSLPLSRLVTSGQKTADAFGTVSKASVPADDGEVLSAEERNLQEAIDLKMDEPTQVPLAPTSGGWSIFGVAWYWWGTGFAAAWVSGVGLRWWLRKS